MTEKQTTITTFKQAFNQQRENRVDKVLVEAQRLVNLYHHAEAFGGDFQNKLDEMLLAASPEVQSALSEVLGGAIVRQYYEFLKDKRGIRDQEGSEKNTEENEVAPVQTGYLPSPEDDMPIGGGTGLGGEQLQDLIQSYHSGLEKMLQAQTDMLAQLLQKGDASHETTSAPTRFSNKQYSDVIEAVPPSQPQPEKTASDETEGF